VSNARVKVVVGAFAAARVAIGVAFAVAPTRFGNWDGAHAGRRPHDP